MSAGLKVITPGLMTSVQDRGRFGFQALGISVSGALDPDGFDLANALAGNEAGTGALEIRMLGPTLEVTAESVTLALAGTGAGIEVMSPEREMISACRSVTFRKGQVFRIGAIGDSAVCYLAVHGGFDLPRSMAASRPACRPASAGSTGASWKRGIACRCTRPLLNLCRNAFSGGRRNPIAHL